MTAFTQCTPTTAATAVVWLLCATMVACGADAPDASLPPDTAAPLDLGGSRDAAEDATELTGDAAPDRDQDVTTDLALDLPLDVEPDPPGDSGGGGLLDLPEPEDDGEDVEDADLGDAQEAEEEPARHPNLLDQEQLFTCDAAPGASPARIRRLESREWSRSIFSDKGLLVPLLPRAEHRYSTYSSDETMDAATLREYMRHNGIPGGTWSLYAGNGQPRIVNLRGAGSLISEVRCFQWNWNDQPVQEDPSPECIEQFVSVLLEHGVLFRPPTQDEVARLSAFAQSQVEREHADEGLDRRDTIRTVVRAAWMMSGAIFRPELGQEEADEHGRHRLTDQELGISLSLALGDHVTGLSKAGYGSDDIAHKVMLYPIQEAVQSGTISQPEVVAQLVRRYLAGADPAVMDPDLAASDYPPGYDAFLDMYWMSPKLQRFFREWLGYGSAHDIFKDHPAATSAFASSPINNRTRYYNWIDQAYNSAQLPTHLDAIIARVVVEDEQVLEKLLTDRRYLVPSMEGQDPGTDQGIYKGFPYNINILETGPIGPSLEERWQTMPAQERSGVLTHPAWLAAHGGNFENDPSAIYRGKWIYEELLCLKLPDLPLTVDAMLDPASDSLSARERMRTQLDEDPYCSNCHALMNPLGYPFETYNHAGFWRVEDHGAPPDGSSTLLAVPSDDALRPGMQVQDAVDMMGSFARSTRVKRCFVRQSFRYFMGRDETYEDACALQGMEQAYDASHGSMTQMLTALFQSDAFLYRRRPTDTQE